MTAVRVPQTPSVGQTTRAQQAALDLIKRGIMPIPVPYGTKNPSDRRKWQDERYTADDLSAFAYEKLNVGMRLGHITDASGAVLTDKFVDVDLDCPEAVRAARYILPATGMIWGRTSNPRSHYGYRLTSTDGAESVTNFNDPTNPRDKRGKADARICELRYSGQTIAPGSTNRESGTPEVVRWEPDGDGDPAVIPFTDLRKAVELVYAVALMARHWRDGIRHDATLPLAGLLYRGHMPQDQAERYVELVCKVSGEATSDIANRLGCVRDTYQKAQNGQPVTGGPTLETYVDKRVITKVSAALNLQRASTSGDTGPDGFSLTEIGNAERFAARFEGEFLYCDDQNQWYQFSGGVWRVDRRNAAQAAVRTLIREFRILAANPTIRGTASQGQVDAHIREWSKARGINATLNLARSDLSVLPEQFDGDPWLLNVRDGTVVLGRDGTHHIRIHRWQDLMTKQWQANYNPDAVSEGLEWYRRTFVPEDDRWRFIGEAIGYSLTGLPKRFNFQLLGPSHAGKSMLLRLLKVHADGYGAALKYSALKPDRHDSGGDRPRSDLLALRGARLLTIAEVDGGTVWDTTLFKTLLSGGDAVTVRGAYEKRGQTFPFTVSLWTSGNDAYGADASDDASYERVHVIKFEHPIPIGQRDDSLEDDIVNPDNSGDAFLAFALAGFARLYGEHKGNLVPPDSVRQETENLRTQLDPFAEMFENYLEFTNDENDGVLKSEVNELGRYVWQAQNRGKWGTKVAWDCEKALQRRGAALVQAKSRFENCKYWRGVRWSEAATFVPIRRTMPNWPGSEATPTEQ